MHNVNVKASGKKLVIEIDTSPEAVKAARLSSTGKTRLLATTGGAMPVECDLAGVKLAVNVMIPAA